MNGELSSFFKKASQLLRHTTTSGDNLSVSALPNNYFAAISTVRLKKSRSIAGNMWNSWRRMTPSIMDSTSHWGKVRLGTVHFHLNVKQLVINSNLKSYICSSIRGHTEGKEGNRRPIDGGSWHGISATQIFLRNSLRLSSVSMLRH